MTKNSLAIVVLNWNGADDAIKCMESLLAQTPTVPDIILVDNNSADNSIKVLENFISTHNSGNITLIKNSVNSGFSGGNNVGFTHALKNGYIYIGTLNPDAVADENWANALVQELVAYPNTGIVAGILARSDKTRVDSTGDFYTTWGIPGPRGRDGLLSEAPKSAEYVFGATGGGFIARASTLQNVGLFDEKFFMYYEDVDFCFRAQLAGFKVRYTPAAIAYHKISASTNKVPGLATTQTFKNLPLLFLKNVPLRLWPTVWPRFALAYTLILGNAILDGRSIPALKGWFKSIVLLPHALTERSRIQKNKKVTVGYITSIIVHDIPPEQTGMRKFRAFFTGKQ